MLLVSVDALAGAQRWGRTHPVQHSEESVALGHMRTNQRSLLLLLLCLSYRVPFAVSWPWEVKLYQDSALVQSEENHLEYIWGCV